MDHRRMIAAIAFAAGSCGVLAGASAQPSQPSTSLIDASLISEIRDFLDSPVVWKSVKAQNARTASYDQAKIDEMDQLWVAQRKNDNQPLIASVLTSPLSVYLTRIQAANLGLYTEMFVMDGKGLNVGQSATTSDYWQGDEAKYQKTFLVAPDAVFIDEAEYDDERGIWHAQVNLTLTAPDGATPIGAATIEVNLTELERRRALGLGF